MATESAHTQQKLTQVTLAPPPPPSRGDATRDFPRLQSFDKKRPKRTSLQLFNPLITNCIFILGNKKFKCLQGDYVNNYSHMCLSNVVTKFTLHRKKKTRKLMQQISKHTRHLSSNNQHQTTKKIKLISNFMISLINDLFNVTCF